MKKIIILSIFVMLVSSFFIGCDELLLDGVDDGSEQTDDPVVDITITKDKAELLGMSYKDVEKYFKDLGFKKVTLLAYPFSEGKTDGEVTDIGIIDFIFKETEFSNGDIFTSDCEIEISYDKLEQEEEKEDSASLFYSTNDYETAKKGKSGVFSYVSESGSYDAYWIIDFDNDCVYYFTDGNGNSVCDKLDIVSGDLNSRVVIKWDKNTEWYLHFKYVNHPVTLIVNDHFGNAVKFTTTDLDDALDLRDTKTIKEW